MHALAALEQRDAERRLDVSELLRHSRLRHVQHLGAAAEAVIDLSPSDDTSWTMDVVHALVDKSFVRPRGDDRFDLLVSVQVYAAEHLHTEGRYPGSGPQAFASAELRHIAWFGALGRIRAVEDHCADLDNLMTACRRAATRGDGDSAADALEGASAALMLRGPYRAAVELAATVCAMPGLSNRAAAHSLSAHASALAASGSAELARTRYDQALIHARTAGDRQCEASIAFRLGDLCYAQSRMDEARFHHEMAIRMAKELGDRRLECSAANGLGVIEFAEGRWEEASQRYEYALDLARETGNRQMLGGVLGNLANLHGERGRLVEARMRLEEATAIARETGNRKLEGVTLANLGQLHLIEGRLDEAVATSKAALVLAGELGHVKLEYNVLCNLGFIQERLAHPKEAQAHFEAAVRLANALGDFRSEGHYRSHLGLLHARLGRQNDAQSCLDSGESLLRAASDPLGLGLLLTSRVEAHHLAGDRAAAETCLAEAAAIAADLSAGPSSDLDMGLARVRALIRLP
jgi:tetratricopeptide (TPR) repeat protein